MSTPRLSSSSIDCSEDASDDGVRFSSAAFGVEPRVPAAPDESVVHLPGAIPGMNVEVQRVGAPNRCHVDLAAPDVDAEVARFESLGAERVGRIETWWVMRAPTGRLPCVVPDD